jgi:uncharacterized protein with beta-barrel porin domain
MRGRLKTGNVGSAFLLASVSTIALFIPTAFAADLTVTTARTTPASTSAGDGSGPGNITVEAAGSVAVTTDPAAITIDSNHTVANNGAISNTLETNASGIFANTTSNNAGVDLTSGINNLGAITINGPQNNSAQANNDVNNAGIRVSGLGTFFGNVANNTQTTAEVTTTGTVAVGGNGSYGMLVDSRMVGDLVNAGAINMGGTNSYGIATTKRITGNFTHSGSVNAGNSNTVGTYIGGGLEGTALFSGQISVGTGARLTSTNGVTLTTLDPLPARAGFWLASDVTQGLLMTGNRMTLTQEQADPTAAAAATTFDSGIALVGGGPGLLVGQGGLVNTPANITIGVGPNNGGYSIKSQGNILTVGSVNGLASTAVSIHGTSSGGVNYTTTLTGGLWNDKGNIQTASKDAVAKGISIGNYAVVSRIQNDGDILVSSTDSSIPLSGGLGTKGGDAYGILVEGQGTLNAFGNTGILHADAQGPTASAYALVDRSGTLTSFDNSGTITASIQTGSTGSTIAVDLSANSSGLTFNNTGKITGEVLLGGGNTAVTLSGASNLITGNLTFQAGASKAGDNTLTMNGGKVTGLVHLGNGTHNVSLTNGAEARIAAGTGTMTLATDASKLTLSSNYPINTTSATFANNSSIVFDVGNTSSATPILSSSGTVSFTGGSKMTAAFSGILTSTQTVTVVRANSLQLSAPLSEIATIPTSFINEASFSISATDPNAIILTARRKTATELGLTANTTAFYNAFASALNLDTAVASGVSAQQTAATFQAAVNQLMPDSSGGTLQAGLNNQDMAHGGIRRRLVGVAKNGMPDHAAGDVSSFWIQALGDYGDQKGSGVEHKGYDIWGLGVAIGMDYPILDRTTNIGIAFTEAWHSISLKKGPRSPIEFYTTQLDLYARYNADNFYVQAIGGGGYNSYNQRRHVVIDTVDRTAVGKWKGYEYGGTVEAGYLTRAGIFKVTPYVRGTYLKHHENGYTEAGGGDGINLSVAARNATSARASGGVVIDRDFPIYYDSYVEAQVRANYTREVMKDPYDVTARFASAGPSFTNTTQERGGNRANLGFGIAHKDSYSSVSLDYDAEYAKGYIGHVATVTARFRF